MERSLPQGLLHSLLPTAAGCIGFLIIVSFILANLTKNSNRYPLPPGPKPKPIIGNLFDMPTRDSSVIELYTKHRELYGPISSLTVFGQTLIIVNEPDIAHELMDKRSSKYSARPVMQMAGNLVGLDQGVILCQPGHRFREIRKVFHNLMGSPQAVSKWRKEIDIEVRRYLLRVLNSPEQFLEHIRKEAASLSLKLTYGYEVNPSGPDVLVDMAESCMDTFSKAAVPGVWMVDVMPALQYVPEWFPGAGFRKIAREWKDGWKRMRVIPYEFAKRQMAIGSTLTTVVSGSFSKRSSTITEEDEDILSWAALGIYGAGADTTATLMEVFYLSMLHYPDVLHKAQKEIDLVIGNDRLPDENDRDKLPYINAVFKEAFRWETIGETGIPHAATEDDIYEGYCIPKGSIVLGFGHGWFHDPKRYVDPETFKPERFLGPSPEPNPMDWVWGHGRRICPGRFLAERNLWLQISQTIAVFDIKPFNGQVPPRQFVNGVVRKPVPFKAAIRVRSLQHERLIRVVEQDAPFPAEGDGKHLNLQV